jgi:hypothetical protein
MFRTTNTYEGILIILIVGTIQTKQTSVGMSTQGDYIMRKQILDMIKREEDGHRRLRNFKAKTN